jgi:hypothetical protein
VGELSTSPPSLLHGALKPRLEYRPPSVRTDGDVAFELAQLAGLTLDPWQRDALDLMLSRRHDGKWACFEYAEIVSRQNGKGSLLEARVLAGLFLFGERLILWSAHQYKTSMEAFLRLRDLVRRLEAAGAVGPKDIKTAATNGEEGFEILSTGQRVKFVARSKSSGRGFSGDCTIIDEAFAYSSEQHAALMPTVSARANPQMIYTSSPPLDGDSGDILYALRDRARTGGDRSLGYRDWGAEGELENLNKVDLDDRRIWAATNPALGIRITEETIARERASMSVTDFARERIGIWPRRRFGEGAIDLAAWTQLGDPDSRRAGDIALAVDIAPKRDFAAIAMYGLREDGLGHLQLVDYRPGTDWIVERLLELSRALNPIAIAMGRGTGASLETELNKVALHVPEVKDTPERGDLAITNATEMSAACGLLIDAITQQDFRHASQHPLDVAVAGAKTRETNDSIAWTRKAVEVDISPLVAVTLARWVYAERAHLIEDDYDVLASIF